MEELGVVATPVQGGGPTSPSVGEGGDVDMIWFCVWVVGMEGGGCFNWILMSALYYSGGVMF